MEFVKHDSNLFLVQLYRVTVKKLKWHEITGFI
jgi:hypothetical protein